MDLTRCQISPLNSRPPPPANIPILSDLRSMGQKIFGYLNNHPEERDVTFCVGREKKKIKTLGILLKAASPIMSKLLSGKWEALGKSRDGIPLPTVEPFVFRTFLDLLFSDTCSVKEVRRLRLDTISLFQLLELAQQFEMRDMAYILLMLLPKDYHWAPQIQNNPVATVPKMQTVKFFSNLKILDAPSFVCDGSTHAVQLQVNKRISVETIGFLGPVSKSASSYEVGVKITNRLNEEEYCVGAIVKKVSGVMPRHLFYISFPKPIILEPMFNPQGFYYETGFYRIEFFLKGPNTQSVRVPADHKEHRDLHVVEDGIRFHCRWRISDSVCQLARLVFSRYG